jgi:DNA adenine methylase
MLFYVDPPYDGSEHYLGRGMFERAEFEALAAALKGLRRSFVLSLNDVPEIRELFAWARVEGAETTYFVGDRPRAAAELIIRSP